MVWFNMDGIPKSDIKSVIKSDISIKPATDIQNVVHVGHLTVKNL